MSVRSVPWEVNHELEQEGGSDQKNWGQNEYA